jgi:hypothetical protein
MMTLRYHFGTIIAIFLALGLGIVIGGTLGQPWISSTQHEMFQILAKKYDETTSQNMEMQKQMKDLSTELEQATVQFSTLLTRTMDPVLQGKNIVWINDGTMDASLISMVIRSAGGSLEQHLLPVIDFNEWNRLSEHADIILVSNEQMMPKWIEASSGSMPKAAFVPVLLLQSSEPAQTAMGSSTMQPEIITSGLDLTQPDSMIPLVQLLQNIIDRKEGGT